MSFTLIETKTLGTAASTIEFTSIPQDGTDLLVLTSLRNTSAITGWQNAFVRPNGATTNLSSRVLYGFPGNIGSFTDTIIYHLSVNGNDTANTFANSSIYIPNYSGSTTKSFSVDTSTESNSATANNAIVAGLWNQTTAITSLSFVAEANNFAVGSTISLYKITKGSSG